MSPASTLPAFDVDAEFASAFSKAIEEERNKSGYAPEQWQSAGRANDQGEAYWLENGPGYARNFIDWYESRPDVNVWIAPDGRPAIELDMTADFGGSMVRGVVDLVLAIGDRNPALVVTDIKSGSTKPSSARQLAIGASLVEATFGVRPRYGAFFMARGTGTNKDLFFQQPVELRFPEHSIPYLGGEFRMMDFAANNGIFPAHPSYDNCRRCPVAYACTEKGGAVGQMYDPNHPHYSPTPERRNN